MQTKGADKQIVIFHNVMFLSKIFFIYQWRLAFVWTNLQSHFKVIFQDTNIHEYTSNQVYVGAYWYNEIWMKTVHYIQSFLYFLYVVKNNIVIL